MLLDHEIAEVRSVEHLNREVLSPSGDYVRVTHVCKTIPLPVWRIATEDFELKCSSKHLVISLAFGPTEVDQLKVGQFIFTEKGYQRITEIEDLEETRALYDLRVDSEDHLYITDGIASHNSTGLCGAELFKFNIIPNYRNIYITPLQEQLKTIADKMMDMQRGSAYPPRYYLGKGYRNNMYYKESPRGGSIKLIHILTDPSKIRGNAAQSVTIDECVRVNTNITLDNLKLKAVEDLEPGDKITCFDPAGVLKVDRVRKAVPKGKRHTWTVRLRDGRELTCTSNEKIRTTRGWVYLSQLLTPAEAQRCDRAVAIEALIHRSRGDDSGVHARRYVGRLETYGRSVSQGSDDSRMGARALQQPQSQSIGTLLNDAAEVGREQGLREVELSVSHCDVPSIRVLTLRHAPPHGGEGCPAKNRHPRVGGATDAKSAGLLVYGRRDTTDEMRTFHDPQLQRGGVPTSGGSPGRDGLRGGICEADKEEQPHLSSRSHTYGGDAEISIRHPDIRPPIDDLQVGASSELPCLQLLSRGIRNRQDGESFSEHDPRMLHKGHLPSSDATGSSSAPRRAATSQATAHQSESQRKTGSDESRGAAEKRPGSEGGAGQGPFQRNSPSVEEAKEGGRDQREAHANSHVQLLQREVRELGHAQDGQKKPIHLVPGRGMHESAEAGSSTTCEGRGATEISRESYGDLVPVEIESITYAGVQEVWDVETENHHTLFAGGFAVHNCQDFDPEHLPEIEQVQRSFPHSRTTMFAGTSKDLDTCLEAQYRFGSMAEWHIPCTCKDKFHSLADADIIEGMLTVDGMRCPNNFSHRLNPLHGFFVHMQESKLRLNMPSFHLPQVIVPEYSRGPGYMQIYKDFKRYNFTKFLQEVWGIAVASGKTEISERDLKACCTDFTFEQTQERFFSKKQRYVYVISGVDWGGSDWEPAYRSKLSYTVHTIWGMKGDGTMDLLYAHRYEAMNYQEIAGTIVEKHNEFEGFAMGTDNGGGAYYNAYMRDCGRIPTNRIIHFQYTDTQLVLDRIKHPEAHIMSLHRTDSISALYADLKGGKITWPRWDEVCGFALDFLNTRRNITETPAGRTILRFIKHGAKADDFMMSTNYAVMMKRIINREPFIPNQQIMDEIRTMFGIAIPNQVQSGLDDLMGGGYVSG